MNTVTLKRAGMSGHCDSAVAVLHDMTVSSVHIVDPGLCLHRHRDSQILE